MATTSPKSSRLALIQVGPEFHYAVIKGFLNEVAVFSELDNETRIGGFVRDSKRIDASNFTKFGIVFEGAYQAAYSGDVLDIAYQVATPEGLYSISLATTMDSAIECLDKFGVINRIEDTLQLGYNRQDGGLILRTAELIIEGDHSEDATFLGWLGPV